MAVNWQKAFVRLFHIINKEKYYKGSEFINIARQVDDTLPSYNHYIDQRRSEEKSTTREDFFWDIIRDMDEAQKHEFFRLIIEELEPYNLPSLLKLKELLGEVQASKPVIQKVAVPTATLPNEVYFDILDTTYNYLSGLEKKPSLYRGKDEEDLRDLTLSFLETRYERTTATGETFNKGGKTDILIRNDRGENLFIAECKVWHGAKEFSQAINQLFDNYVTWRDTKVALILFVRNKNFSQVLERIKVVTKEHPYFISEVGARGESSFSYRFRHPEDSQRVINFEIMAFACPDLEVIKQDLARNKDKNGTIMLTGFYDEGGFQIGISTYQGEILEVRIGNNDDNRRITIYTPEGKSIGGIFNPYGPDFDYEQFSEALREFIGSRIFNVIANDIEEPLDNRTWFSIQVV